MLDDQDATMVNTRDYEQALGKLRGALSEAQSHTNFKNVTSNRDIVLARYHPAFQFDTILQLSEETFRSFLYIENNHHWSGLYRKALKLCENMPALRSALATLLNPTLPLAGRWNKSIRNLRGLGKALATAILIVSSPNEFGVWNNTSERALRILNIWPNFSRGSLSGEKYEIINQLLNHLAMDLGIDLWTLDALMWGVVGKDIDTGGMNTPVDGPVDTDSRMKKNARVPDAMSFETIANSLKTIKEYRDYYDPGGSDWVNYVSEIFHVLGFNTEKIDARLFLLKDMGSMTPQVIVLCNFPGENDASIAPGISWDSYLRFAANYYKVNWGILTNGQKLKVFDYENIKNRQSLCWEDLDEIIKDQQLESFFSIYKTFSSLRTRTHELPEKGSTTQARLFNFWKSLLDQAKIPLPRSSTISPGKHQWITMSTGTRGLGYNFVIRSSEGQVELYIDQGNVTQNKQLFDKLYSHKERIEEVFGDNLEWQRLNDKRASRIRYLIEDFGLVDEDNWQELQKKMIEAMVRLQKAFNPEINRLK